MGQIKVYGLKDELNNNKEQLSRIIHECLVNAFQFPANKKFQRFFPLCKADFVFPSDRSNKYTIIELSLFEGRSEKAKKDFIMQVFLKMKEQLNIDANDVEITIFETPKCNWGIRGLPGDELKLTYSVNI